MSKPTPKPTAAKNETPKATPAPKGEVKTDVPAATETKDTAPTDSAPETPVEGLTDLTDTKQPDASPETVSGTPEADKGAPDADAPPETSAPEVEQTAEVQAPEAEQAPEVVNEFAEVATAIAETVAETESIPEPEIVPLKAGWNVLDTQSVDGILVNTSGLAAGSGTIVSIVTPFSADSVFVPNSHLIPLVDGAQLVKTSQLADPSPCSWHTVDDQGPILTLAREVEHYGTIVLTVVRVDDEGHGSTLFIQNTRLIVGEDGKATIAAY